MKFFQPPCMTTEKDVFDTFHEIHENELMLAKSQARPNRPLDRIKADPSVGALLHTITDEILASPGRLYLHIFSEVYI